MKNRVIISLLLVALCAGFAWGQFYMAYTPAERASLAPAYYLAGQAYSAAGKTAKGAEFMQMARNIDPNLDPSKITETALPSAAELLAQGGAIVIGVPQDEQAAARAIDSFLLRFVGALVEENPQKAAGFLDGSVYLSKLGTTVTRASAQAQLATLFAAVKLNELAPSSVYKLDTVVVLPGPQAISQAWGPTWLLQVQAQQDFSAFLPFWETNQQFFIRQVSGDYYISAIGLQAPPAGWIPAPPPPPGAAPPAAVPAGEVSQAVTDAFFGFVDALLAKNTNAAATFLASKVQLVRLQQTMTADEMKTSFNGLAASYDFTGVTSADVIDTSSIFVQPSTDYQGQVSGTVELLTVMTKMDLSATIPFWAAWQGYYFSQDQGNWKIFAIR